jgi:hypothetical protein
MNAEERAEPREPGSSGRRPSLLLAANLIVRVVLLAAVLVWALGRITPASDALRFREIATSRGAPYRDYAVEYAPVELVFARVIGNESVRRTTIRLVVVAFVLDLAAYAIVRAGWGRRAGVAYLTLGLPLLGLRYQSLWYLPVLLAAAAGALARRSRHRSGGTVLAAATLAKVWPVLLVPGLARKGGRRLLGWFGGTLAVGLLGWFAVGGADGFGQVLTFRGATGWEIESSIGTVLWTLGDQPRLEQGSVRVGTATLPVKAGLAVLVLVVVVLVWRRLAAWPGNPLGAPALACLGALLACSPLFSLQYAGWLTPWAAVAIDERESRPSVEMSAAIVLLTAAVHLVLFPEGGVVVSGPRGVLGQGLLLGRNAVCVALPLWFLASSRSSLPSPASAAAIAARPGRSTGRPRSS